jgi:hypothetical protein
VVLSRVWSDWRSALAIVQPDTVIRGSARNFRLFWTWKAHCDKPGRPAVPRAVRDLIRHMSRDNPLWGAPRIHGELLELGIDVGETSVSKYMVHRRTPPSQTWRTFLDNHVKTLVSVDFLHPSDDSVSGPVRVSGAGTRAPAHPAFRRYGASHRGMDRASNYGRPFRGTAHPDIYCVT